MSKKNKNLSPEIEAVNQKNEGPTFGTRLPASKDGRGETDTLTASHEIVAVHDAVAVPGAHKAATKIQLGEKPGHEQGDATPLENSGCSDCKK
jgi:hypothetical protein